MKAFIPVAIAGTVLAAVIGPRGPLGGFWAPPPTAPHAHGAQLAGFIGENMVENAAFGVGLAVLLLGRPWIAARAGVPTAAWLATVWLLASWMPHAALHQHFGMRLDALLPIEWVFHVGAIIAVALLLYGFSGARAPRSGELRAGTLSNTST